jgi:hypothetical protein
MRAISWYSAGFDPEMSTTETSRVMKSHIRARVGRVDGNPLRILADRDAHDVARSIRREKGCGRVDRRRASDHDANQAIGTPEHDETFVACALERDGNRRCVEKLESDVLELDAPIHVERLARVHARRDIEHAQQALDIDVEAEGSVG